MQAPDISKTVTILAICVTPAWCSPVPEAWVLLCAALYCTAPVPPCTSTGLSKHGVGVESGFFGTAVFFVDLNAGVGVL